MPTDPTPPTMIEPAPHLVTTATSQPALRTGFAVLGLASLLDLPRSDRADRMVALGGAAAAGWYLMRGDRRNLVASRAGGGAGIRVKRRG